MVLRGAPPDDVRELKRSARSRRALVQWLSTQSVRGLPSEPATDHELAAYGCALAAWRWSLGTPSWVAASEGPLSPYDFAC